MTGFIFSSLIYHLALQRCNKSSEFSIHGLWPDYIGGGYPQFCTKQRFDFKIIEPILDDLNHHWNSCSGKSRSFWAHEFQKHATCFEPPTTELEYFTNALAIYHKLKDDGTIAAKCHNKFSCMIELPNYNTFTGV